MGRGFFGLGFLAAPTQVHAEELAAAHERAMAAGYNITGQDVSEPATERTVARPRSQALPCFPNVSCAWQPWCVSTKTTYTPPTIQPKPYPVKISKVTFRPFKGKMDGNVVTAFQNDSKEGTKTTTTTLRCRGTDQTTTEPVPGSADVDSDEWHTHSWDELNQVAMDKFHALFTRVRPTMVVSTTASFQKTGIGALLKASLELLWGWVQSGQPRMSVSVRVDTTVRWNWLGQPQAKTYAITIPSVRLPADDVNIDLSLW